MANQPVATLQGVAGYINILNQKSFDPAIRMEALGNLVKGEWSIIAPILNSDQHRLALVKAFGLPSFYDYLRRPGYVVSKMEARRFLYEADLFQYISQVVEDFPYITREMMMGWIALGVSLGGTIDLES